VCTINLFPIRNSDSPIQFEIIHILRVPRRAIISTLQIKTALRILSPRQPQGTGASLGCHWLRERELGLCRADIRHWLNARKPMLASGVEKGPERHPLQVTSRLINSPDPACEFLFYHFNAQDFCFVSCSGTLLLSFYLACSRPVTRLTWLLFAPSLSLPSYFSLISARPTILNRQDQILQCTGCVLFDFNHVTLLTCHRAKDQISSVSFTSVNSLPLI
jgi:hypothetical protein